MCQLKPVIAILLLAGAVSAEDGSTQKTETELHRTWVVTSSEARKESDDAWNDVDLRWSWKFKADGKALLTDRKLGKQSLFRYKVDASKVPHRIAIVCLSPAELKGYRQLGVWKIKDSKLTLHLTPPGKDKYPTKFKGPKQFGFYLELKDSQALGLQP